MSHTTTYTSKSLSGFFRACGLSTCKSISFSLALLAMLSFTGIANAAIMYGDFSDIPPGGVMYLDVEESSFSVPTALYGAPTVTSNDLDFDPNAFGTSSNAGASGLIDGQLNFTLMALPGAGFTGFSIVEGGDYSFSGVPATAGTFVSASAGATISILEVDGVALPSPISLFASDVFTTDYLTTGGTPSTGLLSWSLVTFADLGAAIPFPYTEGATKVEVAINNQLIAGAANIGSTSAIAKKDFQIIPVGDLEPNAIPEPATLISLVTLMVGMSFKRR